uniref:non-specific serine/threonine protein kinase n=1 Tax=Branchiostoma floridae TaxID=7739 RepID=C3YHU4_BRAFL|eukprot:XP_002604070.1 hypothetical protein BRAFLDRAFT_71640 [Branchiostoma floridae]
MHPQHFLLAAWGGDVEKVRRGLEEGLDVNTKDGLWQAHCERLGDYFRCGEGEWWTVTEEGVAFHDGPSHPDSRPSGPHMFHFRSSTLETVHEHQRDSWQKCMQDNVVVPLRKIYIYEKDGERNLTEVKYTDFLPPCEGSSEEMEAALNAECYDVMEDDSSADEPVEQVREVEEVCNLLAFEDDRTVHSEQQQNEMSTASLPPTVTNQSPGAAFLPPLAGTHAVQSRCSDSTPQREGRRGKAEPIQLFSAKPSLCSREERDKEGKQSSWSRNLYKLLGDTQEVSTFERLREKMRVPGHVRNVIKPDYEKTVAVLQTKVSSLRECFGLKCLSFGEYYQNNKRPVDVTAGLGKDTQLLLETETRKQAEYSELVSSVGSEEGTTVKLFLCGDGQVGKTSLRKILKKTGVIVVAFWNIKRRVRQQDVFNPTPGVHVSSKTVPGIGRLSLHDFAGQAQFYVTHAMLLRTTNAIFPVVYKITDGEDEQKRQVHGWLSFIHCSNADPTNKPRIILIASHADKLQDQEAGMRRAKALVEHYRKLFQESLIVSQEVFLINCLEAGSPGIQRLREVLAAFRDDMLKILTLIESRRQERKMFPVMEWQDFLTAVRQATYGTLESRIVHLASSYLHDEGEIIYLRREADSSVVLDPKWLFTSVLGSLLAPDNFPIDKVERTADDYVTVEELKRVFSAVADIPLLIKLLQDFQLCHTYNGRTFILPSLLQQEMEEAAWSPVSSKAVYFGLQIQGRQEIDSFSCDLFPRLQTLLMQAHPDKLSRPLLWKNSAKCTDGKADALLRITQDKRQLNIFVRSTKGFRKDCNSIMDLLKNMTYRLLHETSPGSRSRDMVLSALDLREHRPQPHAYSREEVETAAEEGRDVVHPKRNIPEDVKDLLLHLDSLTGMLGRVARKRPELVETLRHINPILNHLRADDVINLDENDRIRAARTPQDAARELLDILEAKGERACVKFHSVLETCDKFAASLIVEEEMSEEGATAS